MFKQCHDKTDTNWLVHLQKMARGMKFRILEVEGLYYLCGEDKGTGQLICTFVFAYAKSRFSHDAAHSSHFSQRSIIVKRHF